MEMIIRRFAGAFILISLVLAHYHSPNWLWFTAFVGFNLIQSSFTNCLEKDGRGRHLLRAEKERLFDRLEVSRICFRRLCPRGKGRGIRSSAIEI